MSNAIGLILLVCTPYLCRSARRPPCETRLVFVNKPVSCNQDLGGAVHVRYMYWHRGSLSSAIYPYRQGQHMDCLFGLRWSGGGKKL